MRRGLLILTAAVALAIAAPVSASARGHGGHWGGGIVVHGGFIGGWYSPFWGPYWGPYWGPGWGPGYDPYPNTGEVKIDTKVKDAQVFINGAYLGVAHDNKTIHLRPGTYKIEIREPGREPYTQSIYVAVGKTLHLRPEG